MGEKLFVSNSKKEMTSMFQVGDKIRHKNMDQFSHANINSGPFIVMRINEKTEQYTLKQPIFWGTRSFKGN